MESDSTDRQKRPGPVESGSIDGSLIRNVMDPSSWYNEIFDDHYHDDDRWYYRYHPNSLCRNGLYGQYSR